MPPVICIVGEKKSGKTTLIEKLIECFTGRGLSVATIKHDAHDFDLDTEGKDTWRHAKAGASAVMISSPHRAAMMLSVERELGLLQLAAFLPPTVDLVIAEGFSRQRMPKIEVFRAGHSSVLIAGGDDTLEAVATDAAPAMLPGVPPSLLDLNDAEAVADFIQERWLGDRAKHPNVTLVVDGVKVPMKGFVKDVVAGAVLGVVETLKGVDGDPRDVHIHITDPGSEERSAEELASRASAPCPSCSKRD